MAKMASQITSLTIVYLTVIQAQIKENIKAPRHWPLCGEVTGTKCFHLMTSSWYWNVPWSIQQYARTFMYWHVSDVFNSTQFIPTGPDDSVWHHRTWSTLVNKSACYLAAGHVATYTASHMGSLCFWIWFNSSPPSAAYIYASLNWAIIGSDNGLSPGRHQATIWTNAGILLIGPLGTKFSGILFDIHAFSFKEMHLKMSSVKWRPFYPGS